MKPRRPLVNGGAVVNGQIDYDQPVLREAALKAWNGLRITETITTEVQTRRAEQNSFYWAVIIKTIADDTGQKADDVHEYLKWQFNSEMVEMTSPVTGQTERVRVGKSTTRLTVQQFSAYLDECALWAAEFLGVVIPPSEQL